MGGSDWDNLSNNLGSDLAPILALFGEQVTKQYMSESTDYLDSILFALAPLGIITALVSAIRVGGHPKLRSIIGRAKESRGVVEVELLSSTSPDACEVWNGQGIARVLGHPKILKLVYIADGGDNASGAAPGVYTFEDAVNKKIYLQKDPRNAELTYQEAGQPAPSLTVNISVKKLPRHMLWAFVAVGAVLQSAVLLYAGMAVYYFRFPKNGQTVLPYSFPVALVGTTFLCTGMFLCSWVIDRSTVEATWNTTDPRSKMVWLQLGDQAVNDQVFGPYCRIIDDKRGVSSSRRLDRSQNSLVCLATVTTLVGFVLQFVGLRGMHSSVTIAQICATGVMTLIRSCIRIQRDQQNDILSPTDGVKISPGQGTPSNGDDLDVCGHELDWLAKKLEECPKWEVHGATEGMKMVNEKPGPGGVASTVTRIRAQLSHLADKWPLGPREVAQNLKNAIEGVMNTVYSDDDITVQINMQNEGKLYWPISVCAGGTNDDKPPELVYLSLHRTKDSEGRWSPWRADQCELEAVLCLWLWQFRVTGSSSLRFDDTLDSKSDKEFGLRPLPKGASSEHERYKNPTNKRVLGPSTDRLKTDYKLWIFREATFEEIQPVELGQTTGRPGTSRYFGSPLCKEGTGSVLAVTSSVSLDVMCAQTIFTYFVNALGDIITSVGGKTNLKVPEGESQMYGVGETFRLDNTKLAKLAAAFQESGLGSLEEAYMCIIPCLSIKHKLPSRKDVHDGAKRVAKSFQDEQKWKEAETILWWIYNSENYNSVEDALKDLDELFISRSKIKVQIKTGGQIDWEPDVSSATNLLNAAAGKSIGSLKFPSMVLHSAATHGKEAEVGAILDVRAGAAQYGGRTTLQAAAEGGHETVVRLNTGADVNVGAVLESGRTALQAAVEGSHETIIGRLLAAGTEVSAKLVLNKALQAVAETENKDLTLGP